MLVSDKYKIVFIHIQKTGGASLKQLIKQNDPKAWEYKSYHSPLNNVDDFNKFKNYNKIVIVRNSYQICSSCYRFETKIRKDLNKGITYGMDFKTWIQWKNNNNNPNHEIFPKQLPFFTVKNDVVTVDKIIKYSNIKDEIDLLCLEYNMDNNFGKIKSHDYGSYDWKEIYNDKENIKIVEDICKDDIEYFEWGLD